MELIALIFFFVLFMSLAIITNASARNRERKRRQAATLRLNPPISMVAAAPAAVPAARAGYAGPVVIIRRLDQAISQAGLEISAALWIIIMFIAFVLGLAIADLWFGPIISALAGFALASVPQIVLNTLRLRRLRQFSQQLPYVLDLLKSSLESGHSVLRALQMASMNMAEPTASELLKVVEQVRVGMSLPNALDGMYRRVPVEELGFLAASTRVQAEIGSSLAEILEHVAQSVRTRQRLEAQLHMLTAQARASAIIVASLPLVILSAFSFFKPDYARPLFVDPVGVRLLETAVIFNVVAFVAMRRIARVDY